MIIETKRCLHGQAIGGNLPLPDPLEGYIFQGWYTQKQGGTLVDENWIVNESTTLYARWMVDPNTYTISDEALSYLLYDENDVVTGINPDFTEEIPSKILDGKASAIGENALAGQDNLLEVVFVNATWIGRNAFGELAPRKPEVLMRSAKRDGDDESSESGSEEEPKYCSNLQSAKLPKAKTIGEKAFQGCSILASVETDIEATTIGKEAFKNCRNLESINSYHDELGQGGVAYFPCAVSVGENAFQGCDSLNEVELGGNYDIDIARTNEDSGTTIPEKPMHIFRDCPNLSCVKLYGTNVPAGADEHLNSLFGIEDPDRVVDFYFQNGFVGDRTGEAWCDLPPANNLRVTDEEATPYKFAYFQYSNKSITGTASSLPIGEENRDIIDLWATSVAGLANQTRIRTIDLPLVVEVKANAFQGCTGLEKIVLSPNITKIGNYAFDGCTKLKGIVLPATSKLNTSGGLGTYVFNNCKSLKYVLNLDKNDKVTTISDYAFCNCESLEKISLPSTVTTIGIGAFRNCKSMDISLPDSNKLTTIKNNAFFGCESLTEISIPSSVTSIGDSAFQGCTKLSSLTFSEEGAKVTIGAGTFQNCESLTEVTVRKAVAIGVSAFQNCKNLEMVTMPQLTLAKAQINIFAGCPKLSHLYIDNGTTTYQIVGQSF